MTALPPPSRLSIAPAYLLLLAGPAIVFVGTHWFLVAYGDVDFLLAGVAARPDAGAQELTGRYKFFAALYFYGAVSIAVAGLFITDLVTRHTAASRRWVALGIAFVFGVVLVFSVLIPRTEGRVANWDLLGRNVFEATLGQAHVSGCADGLVAPDCQRVDAFTAMVDLLGVIDLLAAAGAAGAILGTILTLSRPARPNDLSTPSGRVEEARALKGATEASKRYLYCSGLMLTSGMTVLLAWMNWPAAVLSDPDVRVAYVNLVGALSLFVGVSYSLLILSYYMPVSIILATRINRLRHLTGGLGDPTSEDQKAVSAMPLIGRTDALKAIIAIISPVLASAVGSFGNALMFE